MECLIYCIIAIIFHCKKLARKRKYTNQLSKITQNWYEAEVIHKGESHYRISWCDRPYSLANHMKNLVVSHIFASQENMKQSEFVIIFSV